MKHEKRLDAPLPQRAVKSSVSFQVMPIERVGNAA
jgi:hypothetical protein